MKGIKIITGIILVLFIIGLMAINLTTAGQTTQPVLKYSNIALAKAELKLISEYRKALNEYLLKPEKQITIIETYWAWRNQTTNKLYQDMENLKKIYPDPNLR